MCVSGIQGPRQILLERGQKTQALIIEMFDSVLVCCIVMNDNAAMLLLQLEKR